jgi:hypothetical protein
VISHLITVLVLVGFAMVAAGLYLLLVLIGWALHVPGLAPIAIINLLLGWTLFGWVAALVLALRPVYQAGPLVQVVPHLPVPSAPPGSPADAGWAGPPGPPPARSDCPPPLLLPPGPAGRPGATG